MYNALSPAQMSPTIYLRLPYDWMLELIAMACRRSSNMLNILHVILSAIFCLIFKQFSLIFISFHSRGDYVNIFSIA